MEADFEKLGKLEFILLNCFFNEDGHSVSFFGFFIQNLNVISEKTGEILHERILSQFLYDALVRNNVVFNKSPKLPRDQYSLVEKVPMHVYPFEGTA